MYPDIEITPKIILGFNRSEIRDYLGLIWKCQELTERFKHHSLKVQLQSLTNYYA